MAESSRRRRSRRRPDRLQLFLRRYWFEIVWLAVVALGLFLIFSRASIRRSMVGRIIELAQGVLRGAGRFGEAVLAWLARITLSDAVGFVLVVGAVVAIVLRMRWRLFHNPALSAQVCPKCRGPLHRVHRTWFDHVISAFVPVRRFRCANRECTWRGLRIYTTHGGARHATSARARST